MPKRLTLLSPGSCSGFASSRLGSALPKGAVSYLYDFRLGDGSLRLRWGTLAINEASPGPFRGGYHSLLSGVDSLFRANLVSGKVRVYRSTDQGATFAEITAAATRFNDTGEPLRFQIVAQDSKEYVAIQNGADAPRIYDGTTVRIVPTLDTSNLSLQTFVDLGPGTVFAGSPTVVATNPSDLDGSVRALGTGGQYLYLHGDPQIDTAGRYVTVTGVSDPIPVPTVADGYQIAFFLDAGALRTRTTDGTNTTNASGDTVTDERWRSLLIEGRSSGGTWTTIYDPSTTAIVAVKGEGNTYLAAVPAAPWAGLTITDLRFSFPAKFGDDDDPDIRIRLYAVKLSGLDEGGTNYGASFGEPGTTIGTDGPTRSGGKISTKLTAATYGGVSLPVSGFVGYVYKLRVDSTTPGVQVPAYVYRNDVGTSGYYYLASFLAPGTYTDPGTGSVDYSRALPDVNALPIPKGTGMASVNGRLFVCAGNRLYYSESERPFVFSTLVLFDDQGNPVPTSAGSFSKPGETFHAVVGVGQVLTGAETLGTPQSGAVSVYCLTDRVTYLLSGWDAASLNKTTPLCIGTRSPFSVTRGASGGFYYLDSDRQVRKIQGSSSASLSRNLVDGELENLPNDRLVWAFGAYLRERFFLAYTPYTKNANESILVYGEASGWESIDRPYRNAQGLLVVPGTDLSRLRLMLFADTGLYEHDAVGILTEGDGSRVWGTVIFPEVEQGFDNVQAGAGATMTEIDAAGTVTLTVSMFSGDRAGDVAYTPVPMTGRYSGDIRSYRLTETGKGAVGVSLQPRLDLKAIGGKRLFRFELEITPQSSDAAFR